jgi:hypothetical protein
MRFSTTRRGFIQSLATLALVGPMPLTAQARRSLGAKKLIVIYADGGWDTTYTFDPKQSSNEVEGPERHENCGNPMDCESVRTISGIPIASNLFKRPNVDAFLTAHGDKLTVVNGIWVGNIAHNECRYRMLTGTPLNVHPDLGVITGNAHGRHLPLGQVDLSGFSLTGGLAASTGRVGARSQIRALIDPHQSMVSAVEGEMWPKYVPDTTSEEAVRDYLRGRAERLRGTRGDVRNGAHLDALVESIDRAERVRIEGLQTAQKLTLGAEPTFNTEMEIAVQLLEEEICQCVMVEASGNINDVWDTHEDNMPQHALWDGLFCRLQDLVDTLICKGMFDDTVVVVLSEMSRTPKYNESGGKDHWPHTGALFLGGGLPGGRVLGGTDSLAESVAVDLETGRVDPSGELLKYDNFVAGILEALDVDPEEWLPGVAPFRGLTADGILSGATATDEVCSGLENLGACEAQEPT